MNETFVAYEDPDGWLRTDDRLTAKDTSCRYDADVKRGEDQ